MRASASASNSASNSGFWTGLASGVVLTACFFVLLLFPTSPSPSLSPSASISASVPASVTGSPSISAPFSLSAVRTTLAAPPPPVSTSADTSAELLLQKVPPRPLETVRVWPQREKATESVPSTALAPSFLHFHNNLASPNPRNGNNAKGSNADPRRPNRQPDAADLEETARLTPPAQLIVSSTNKEELAADAKDAKRAQCRAKYGQRVYLSGDHRRLPPMLYTYPGSGNTWSRLLIEYATGILSGSVYNDGSLREALPGEFKCNYEVSVVKVHPHTHDWHGLHSGHFNSDDNKCKRGNVHHFERAIILLRDPFDSIWSEYQRRVSKSHVNGIPRKNFNWHRWQANAAALGNSYFRTWEFEHSGIERELRPEDYIYLKYEDLKDKSKRKDVLKEILKFLHYDHSNDERIECAFLLAENRQAHRSVDPNLVMTKEQAYIPEIACRMWALFGHYAGKHGYKPWANYSCEGYPKIPRINVGSNGEYDRAWVKPGEKLVDFRTVETIAVHRNQTTTDRDEDSVGEEGPFDEVRKRKRMQKQSENRMRRGKGKNV